MKCLVIGASGYVGRSVVATLIGAGYRVHGLARSEKAAATVAAAGATPLVGAVDDARTLAPHLDDFDAIVFTPQLDWSSEADAVTVLLDALRGSGKSFIMASGTAVLATRSNGDWTEENYAEDEGPPGFENHVRVRTENLVRSYAGQGVRAMVVRPPMIWGHGRCPPLAGLHSSARTGAICYHGRGLNVCSGIHVDDLAEIFMLALLKGEAGALYHAVSGETNWRSIAEHIAMLRGLATRSIEYDEAKRIFGPFLAPVVFGANMRTRCPRTRGELGWKPRADRLDLFGELGHPTFMAISDTDGDEPDFTLAEVLRDGRR